ncbi:MAG: phenylalanine--tRNA ligase subunit alpha [Armatimonadetes bacterium]|nr:phenylalanine--tRNA ligase subunit alpha [Armatimonadota bacterium]
MRDEVEAMAKEAETAIGAAADMGALEAARVEYLGRKGRLRAFYDQLKQLDADSRREMGQLLNAVRERLETLLADRQAALEAEAEQKRLASERIDVTLPGRAPRIGKEHPLLATLEAAVEIFLGLGFRVAEGPEIETYYYSFPALNYPEWHPAMDEQMTFYITDDLLLRSQTSTVQIRTMEAQQPPVRVVVPGRCFRRDTVDATHSHTFYQIEGLLVDEGVTFADLKGTLEIFAREMFGEDIHTRIRPDFFPFTEPSAEFSLTCVKCRGAGEVGGQPCRLCKTTGWLEVGGCGMVDPNVLENVGYDSERYTGWAFGCGIERLAMLRYGIDDIRLFYMSDMRFLEQF